MDKKQIQKIKDSFYKQGFKDALSYIGLKVEEGFEFMEEIEKNLTKSRRLKS